METLLNISYDRPVGGGLKSIFRSHVPIVRVALVWKVAIVRQRRGTLISRVCSRTVEVCIAATITRPIKSLSTLKASGACVVVSAGTGEGGTISSATVAIVAIASLEVAVRWAIQTTVGGEAAVARAVESSCARALEAAHSVSRW